MREDTPEKVLKAIEKLGYVPNSIARSLALKKTATIKFLTLVKQPAYTMGVLVQNFKLKIRKGCLYEFYPNFKR